MSAKKTKATVQVHDTPGCKWDIVQKGRLGIPSANPESHVVPGGDSQTTGEPDCEFASRGSAANSNTLRPQCREGRETATLELTNLSLSTYLRRSRSHLKYSQTGCYQMCYRHQRGTMSSQSLDDGVDAVRHCSKLGGFFPSRRCSLSVEVVRG